MVIKILFLDFDGTISDAKDAAYSSMVRTLDEFGYDFDKKKLLGLMGSRTHVILGELGIAKKNIERVRRRFYGYFTKAALSGGNKPCVSLKPLWKLKEEGVPMFIISNAKDSYLKVSIKKLGLKGLFRGVYGSGKFKSKDELLKKLFKKFGIKASEAVYIGDRFSDVEYARKAGCVAVAIHNKCAWSSLAEIKRERPGHIVKDFYGLARILRSAR